MMGASVHKETSRGEAVRKRGGVRIVRRDKIAVRKRDKKDDGGHNYRKGTRYMDMWVQGFTMSKVEGKLVFYLR